MTSINLTMEECRILRQWLGGTSLATVEFIVYHYEIEDKVDERDVEEFLWELYKKLKDVEFYIRRSEESLIPIYYNFGSVGEWFNVLTLEDIEAVILQHPSIKRLDAEKVFEIIKKFKTGDEE